MTYNIISSKMLLTNFIIFLLFFRHVFSEKLSHSVERCFEHESEHNYKFAVTSPQRLSSLLKCTQSLDLNTFSVPYEKANIAEMYLLSKLFGEKLEKDLVSIL